MGASGIGWALELNDSLLEFPFHPQYSVTPCQGNGGLEEES